MPGRFQLVGAGRDELPHSRRGAGLATCARRVDQTAQYPGCELSYRLNLISIEIQVVAILSLGQGPGSTGVQTTQFTYFAREKCSKSLAFSNSTI